VLIPNGYFGGSDLLAEFKRLADSWKGGSTLTQTVVKKPNVGQYKKTY